MHVNARSSNHDPNHVLDRDPKRLSERDSSPCEHSLYITKNSTGEINNITQMPFKVHFQVVYHRRACSQRNKSLSESHFGSRSTSWVGSWFELRAFTSILQMPSQSRPGSAHCEVIFCSYCAVRADWPMHGFSAHFQNAHVLITFRKSFAFTGPQDQAFYADHDPKRPFFRISKAWFDRVLHSQRVKSRFQIRKGSESRSETVFGTWFVPLWTGPMTQ